MKMKSVHKFTHKLHTWFTLTFVFLGLFSCVIILALIITLPKAQFLKIEQSALTPSIVLPPLIILSIVSILLLCLNNAARDFEYAVETKENTAKYLRKRLEEIDNLLNKTDWAKSAKISSITIGSFKLETETKPQNITISIDDIKKLLMEEKNKIMHNIRKNENALPKKPRTYAFLEKRLHLTPLRG